MENQGKPWPGLMALFSTASELITVKWLCPVNGFYCIDGDNGKSFSCEVNCKLHKEKAQEISAEILPGRKYRFNALEENGLRSTM